MDAGQILTTVLGILSQPFVKKVAESTLEHVAEAAGKAGGEGVIKTLQKFLKLKGQEQALADVAKDPENEEHQDALEAQIKLLLKHNPDFLREIDASIQQMPAATRNEQMIRGNNIRNAKQVMTGEGGAQTMDARGDVDGASQQMDVSKAPDA